MVAGAKSFLASLGISHGTHQICVWRSGKVRERCAEKVRESQGIQIQLTGGNPGSYKKLVKSKSGYIFILATHKLVTIAFCPRVIEDYGRESNKTAERSLLINLAIDYIEVKNVQNIKM